MIRGIIILLIWTGTIHANPPTQEEPGYQVEKYGESTGIYYEGQGQLSLYNTEWQVVVYANLKEIDNRSNEIELYLKHINTLCQDIAIRNWTDCYHFPEIAKEKLQRLKKTENLIIEVSDRRSRKPRRRRGVFNFIGEVSKVLFGTLDNEDATYYNEQIKHFEENSDDLTRLLRQQLVVVRSTLGTINDTLIDMETNQENVRAGLTQVKKFLETVT
jgi:hypothetical protein